MRYGILHSKKSVEVTDQNIPEEENEQSASNMSQIKKDQKTLTPTIDNEDNVSQIPSEIAQLKVSHNNIKSEVLKERPIKNLR